jgi:hypothetical protein
MDNKKKLLDIFKDDPLGILDVKPSNSSTKNEKDRLEESFQEILDFFKQNKREPQIGNTVQEASLYFRLKAIRENPDKKVLLSKLDKYGLLSKPVEKEIKTIEDIFNNDTLGILDDGAESIFTFKHVPKPDTRESADFIANRKPCKNFAKYEHLFKAIQSDLSTGKRNLVNFSETSLKEGNFYVNNGILLYLEKVNLDVVSQQYKSGSRVRKDGRTKCIFENGTQSNMLYRSLYKALLSNGKTVTKTQEEITDEFNKKNNTITEEDKECGFIYVLKSCSKEQKISTIQNLYKIGYSNIPIEERIKNAEQEPTYLMAPVKIVTTFKCYNLNPQKLELLLHNFFGDSCLNIDVFDNSKKRHTPREWFIAPLNVIEQAIEFIISGEIVDYKYDKKNQEIIYRKQVK